MLLKKVLIITYYWPPSGGAGVQRWLKFSKYLPSFDWQPVIYTPSNPEAPVDDPSLQQDIPAEAVVVKRPILEPYTMYKKFIGMGKGDRINAGFLSEDEKPRKKEGLAVWIRGNLFIPDARRFWIRPSIRFLMKYLRNHPVDALVSTGPPHSMHLIAYRLHQKLKIPWIADFRDPWTEIDFYDQLRLTRRADRKHHRLEATVLNSADRVVVVGKTMAERFHLRAGIEASVIPNGYDEPDFDPAPPGTGKKEKGKVREKEKGREKEKLGEKEPGVEKEQGSERKQDADGSRFNVVHVGAMNRDRNHPAFWEALATLSEEDREFKSALRITLVGKLDHSVHQSLAAYKLEECTVAIPSLPHREVIPLLQAASVLYLPINNTPNARSIATGKIYEYLSAGRPILGVGPEDGDAAEILNTCGAGRMLNFTDREGIREILASWALQHRNGELLVTPGNIERYSRKNLTAGYALILDQLTSSPSTLKHPLP